MNRMQAKGWLAPAIALALGLSVAAPVFAQGGTRPHAGMLRHPTVGKTQIAFVYAGKLWLAPKNGGMALPSAAPPGTVASPHFSPDGATLAFTANYDGNYDLYTVPVAGGNPTRITHHPGFDNLCGWAPDGRLLYANNAYEGQARFSRLLLAPAKGGNPSFLPVPYGEDGAISPDGRWLAYTPSSTNNRTWKRYRGGWAQDIWLFDLQTKAARKITDWEGTDTLPMWSGEKVYYLSDNGPEHRLNLWVYDIKTGKRRQVTRFADFDVKWPSIGPDAIVFEHGAELRLLDLATEQTKPVEITIPGDQLGVRTQSVDAARNLESWSVSPSAKRVAVTARGDIWTLPAKDGSPRNLTRTAGAHEKDATWSPDGKWIAYTSDATGEYEIYVVPADGKGEAKRLTSDGAKYRDVRSWSPDSKKILFSDNTGAHYLIPVEGGPATLVVKNPLGNPLNLSWSHDSRWIAYAHADDVRGASAVWIYSVETGQRRKVTRGMFDDTNPTFDRKGEWLYYVSSRVFRSPIYDDYQTTWIYPSTQAIVAVPLRADIASPYIPKSDEETAAAPKTAAEVALVRETVEAPQADPITGDWTGTVSGTPMGDLAIKLSLKLGEGGAVSGTADVTGVGAGTVTGAYDAGTRKLRLSVSIGGAAVAFEGTVEGNRLTASGNFQGSSLQVTATRQGGAPAPTPAQGAAAKTAAPAAATKVTIDFDDFEARGQQLAVAPGRFGSLAVNAQNQLLFVRASSPGATQPPGIKLFDLNDARREEKVVAAGGGGFDITADGKKLLVIAGPSATLQDATPGAVGEPVPTAGMQVTIDPRAEWRQMLREAWRIERDYFYDPTLHGVEWKAILTQYEAMLPDAASRADVGYIISEMISELNVGHAYYGGAPGEPEPVVPVGALGCDYTLENGAYRIARIVRGAPWDTDAIGPLSAPGSGVKEGDYLLAVNGVPVDATKDPSAALIGTAGRITTLTVSAKPTIDKDAREVQVRPLASERGLRYRAWIERNRAHVEKASGGKVGYIYVPDTGVNGQSDLVRQFVGQTGKEALIIDDRWNGGGQIPTRFIELLSRPLTNVWARRDGQDWLWPPDGHFGPKCMLINGLAGSGGDAFPYYFRQAKLGKLIGTRTWGGLVGISGTPSLIDGANVTAPSFAFFENDGTWGIEGHGVDPDIEVMDDPSKMQDGADPQLDAAIAQMLKEIKEKPFVAPKRPAYPNRRGMGIDPKDR